MIVLLACAPVDPLAGLRSAMDELPPLEEGWAPQATLFVGQETLDELVLAATPSEEVREVGFRVPALGLDVAVEARSSLSAVEVVASSACVSCLQVSARFRVDTVAELSNETGAMERRASWLASAKGLLEIGIEEEASGDALVVARPASVEGWEVDVTVEGEGADPLELPVARAVAALVGERELRAFPLARLQRDAAVRVRGVRVRGIPDGIVVDQSFAVPRAGVAEPVVGAGWTATVPEDTLLGLAEAAALSRGHTAEGVAVPTDLSLDEGGFSLGVELWPAGKRRPVRARVDGTISVSEGELRGGAEVDLADPLMSLLGGRIAAEIERATRLAVPAQRAVSRGGLEVEAAITSIATEDGVLLVSGELAAVSGSGR